jgi:hypothetical protein
MICFADGNKVFSLPSFFEENTMQNLTPLARKANLVIQELDNEILIYDLKINKVFSLNETSALVWQFSDGSRSTAEIAQVISQTLKLPIKEDFVWLALSQLGKEKLLDNEIPVNFQGSTRREVIKRIGLASMITLPMISTLIAPAALHAQSTNCGTTPNIALGCSCVVGGLANSSNCASQCCNFVNAGLPGVCVVRQTVANGGSCNRACQCVNLCCVGGSCSPVGFTNGTPCVNSCQCASSICAGGVCITIP